MQGFENCPEFLRAFFSHLETIQGKSPLTVSEYYSDLRTFLRYMKVKRGLAEDKGKLCGIPIDDVTLELVRSVTTEDIYDFLVYAARKRENTQPTRARKLASIKAFYKYLVKTAHLVESNPAKEIDSPKLKKTLPRYLNLEESVELLEAVDGEFPARDYAILTLFLNCGMRLSELVGIDLSDIDWKDETLRLTGKGNKERVVYLNEACLAALRRYLEARPVDGVEADSRNALFLSKRRQRISVKTVQWIVYRTLDNAGLGGRHFSTHKLRHTAATLMYRQGGVDVRTLKDILGHEQLSTTQIYTHVSDEQMKDAAAHNPLAKVAPPAFSVKIPAAAGDTAEPSADAPPKKKRGRPPKERS